MFVDVCIPNIPLFVFRFQTSFEFEILTSSMFGHVVLVQVCHFVPPSPRYIKHKNSHMSFHFFLSSVLILAPPHRQKITGAEREPSPSPPPPPLWKGRAGKEGGGGGRQRGEGNTTQTELCLTSPLPERRKGWYKARLNRIEREERGRAEEINAKNKGWQWCTRAASVLVHREQKNIVSVNGSCWSLTHGECSEKAGRLAWALAWSKRGVLRSLMRILERYDSRRLPLERIWTCCHFWLSSVCDVEAPLGCFIFTTLPLPVQRLGYGPVWRRRASSRRWRAAAAVWRAEPVNNSMGAKQMKW